MSYSREFNQTSDHREVIFRWLHLTDLHLGMDGLENLWQNVEKIFFDDLEYLCEKVGPWDLVMFTGDITQRGIESEFQQVDKLLDKFWDNFDQMGFKPKFLAVPGNHDLVRPDDEFDTALIGLEDMWSSPKIQKPFWDKIESPQRQLVIKAFENYVEWWDNTTVPKPDIYSKGILPGDFSATIEKDGFKLGILGLNSAFLQLMGGDRKGKLALDLRQFHGACNKNGPSWAQAHHACLLLTHHPQDWLTDEAQAQLNGEIHSPPERFALHLFGHMHESKFRSLAQGGANDQRRLQGCSLFGMEGWGDKNQERLHGYSLCELKIKGNTAFLRIYPRKAWKKQDGGREIGPDPTFRLPKGEDGTKPVTVELLYKQQRAMVAKDKIPDQKFSDLDYLEKLKECQTSLSSLIEHRIQVKDWKYLHENFQNLSLRLINLRGFISGKDYKKSLQLLHLHWSMECLIMINNYTNFDNIPEGQVRKKFEKINRNNNWLETINDFKDKINQLVIKCVLPENLKETIEELDSFLCSLEMINGSVLSYLDDQLKNKLSDIEKEHENFRFILTSPLIKK